MSADAKTRFDMLTIIEMKHNWITRFEIAQALDRKYNLLSSDDIRLLRRLTSEGVIEARQHKEGYVVNRWEYRYIG